MSDLSEYDILIEMTHRKNGEDRMKKPVLIALVFMLTIILLTACGGSDASVPEKGDVLFCTNVDEDGNAINASSNFEAGEVYVLFKTDDPFNTIRIKQTIYKIQGDQEEIIFEQNIRVKSSWFMLWGPRNFSESGKYRVEYTRLTNAGTIPMGEGTVTIF